MQLVGLSAENLKIIFNGAGHDAMPPDYISLPDSDSFWC